uniref:Ferrochelatase n=1 Tax=Magnetococcus massalia (strain MO-1) TaxID=451514 RepID=A0A1S7LG36_MAGMO|nr:Ferrochelatase [Candidatus Magnetococcus massalia]
MAFTSTAILLVQLGTPDAPTEEAVRRYLRQFLSDRRVVDTNRLLWWPLLHGVILRSRPKKSAKLYKSIWRQDGASPLLHYTRNLQRDLHARFRPRGVRVVYAMRYGNPGLRCRVGQLIREGVRRLLIAPLFPQYSGATVASVYDEAMRGIQRHRTTPTIRFLSPYFYEDAYIDSLAAGMRDLDLNDPEHKMLFSYHGLPQRHIEQGDPYAEHCQTTSLLLAEELDIAHERWEMSYQSRFGRDPWLTPNTADRFKALPQEGVKKLSVVCPGFAADCLETLEEIAVTGRETFMKAGGQEFNYIPALNDSQVWIDAMERMLSSELHGWIYE